MKKLSDSKDVEVRKQIVSTTLIRDQNGLGFSIAGGTGCPPFKDNSDVSKVNLRRAFFTSESLPSLSVPN